MSSLTESEERQLAIARERMDRYHIAFSVLAQEENSPYMTDEFQRQLAEAKEKLAPYTVRSRATKTK